MRKDYINPWLRQSFKGGSTIMRKINSIERGLYESIDHMSFPAMEWLICHMVLNRLIPIENVLSAAGYSESEVETMINRWNKEAEESIDARYLWLSLIAGISKDEVLTYLTKKQHDRR